MITLAARPRSVHLLGWIIALSLANSALAQGKIVGWGPDTWGSVSSAPAGGQFTQLSAGDLHSVALHTDGSVHSWGIITGGMYDYDQVTGSPDGTGFTAVSAGGWHNLALKTDGSIIAWGIHDGTGHNQGQVTDTPGGTGYTQIAAGQWHSVALNASGRVVSWGGTSLGQSTNQPSTAGFTQLAAGGAHTLALRTDGSIVSWGADFSGAVANTPTGTGFIDIAAGWEHALALRADGSIVAWGSDNAGQVSGAPSGTGFIQVAGGWRHSRALRADGSIVSWGNDAYAAVSETPNYFGMTLLGDGACGRHALALRANNRGSAFCFGDGTGTACPCGANGDPGEGCANTGGSGGARLAAAGDAYIAEGTLRFNINGVPGNKPGLVLLGSNPLDGGLGNPAGDGLLCVGGQTSRSHIQVTQLGSTQFTDFHGNSFASVSFGAGNAVHYQFWYRNQSNPCSGSGFNFSNAWTVRWLP